MALDSRIWSWCLMTLLSFSGFIGYCMWLMSGLREAIYLTNQLVTIQLEIVKQGIPIHEIF